MTPPVEGLRAPLREPAGIRGEASRATGPGVSEERTNAGRLPVPAQAGGEGVNSMENNGLIISVTYESNSEELVGRQDFPTLWRERKRSCRHTEPWCLRDRTMPKRVQFSVYRGSG